jgi:hypothetical protein
LGCHLNDALVASKPTQQLNQLNIMSTNNAATPAAGVAGREGRNQGAEECVDGPFRAEARRLNDAGWVLQEFHMEEGNDYSGHISSRSSL